MATGDIEKQLQAIFATHQVASYTGIVKEIRQLAPQIFLLRAVAGMVPPGKDKINPAGECHTNPGSEGRWRKNEIALLQNTPAAFHGRPELSTELTNELAALL